MIFTALAAAARKNVESVCFISGGCHSEERLLCSKSCEAKIKTLDSHASIIEEKSYQLPKCQGQLQGVSAVLEEFHLKVFHKSKYSDVAGSCSQRGLSFSGAFCFECHLKCCKTNCFLVLYQWLRFLPKVLIIPGHCTWQNSHIK